MAQTRNDLALWEAFLRRHRVGSIIELGTWEGGMSLYLAHQCKYRGGQFVTVDWDLSRGSGKLARFVRRPANPEANRLVTSMQGSTTTS